MGRIKGPRPNELPLWRCFSDNCSEIPTGSADNGYFSQKGGTYYMLLKKYWDMITEYCNSEHRKQVGLYCSKIMKGEIWGFSSSNYEAKAWQRHKIQPSRGFFSKLTCSEKSLAELIDAFSILYKKSHQNINILIIKQWTNHLFSLDIAAKLLEAHNDEVMTLQTLIDNTEDTPINIIALMTTIFWFFLSIRPPNITTFKIWKNNPDHDIPCPQNCYYDILAILYKNIASKVNEYHIYPEDSWVMCISTGYPSEIDTEMQKNIFYSNVIKYDEDKNIFYGLPEEWDDLHEIFSAHCDMFRKHYTSQKEHAGYCSTIAGIMKSEYITSVPPKIRCQCYEIDYITHRTIEAMVKELKSTHPEMKEKLSLDIKKTIECKYGWLRTSVGVNIIVEVPHDNVIILCRRGQTGEYETGGKIYPTVVKTIDFMPEHQDFSLTKFDAVINCTSRGIEEEIGLPNWIRDPHNIRMYEQPKVIAFARTKDYDQDNFFLTVKLNNDVSLADVGERSNHALKRLKEIDELIPIVRDPKIIIQFLSKHQSEMINQTSYALWLYTQSIHE